MGCSVSPREVGGLTGLPSAAAFSFWKQFYNCKEGIYELKPLLSLKNVSKVLMIANCCPKGYQFWIEEGKFYTLLGIWSGKFRPSWISLPVFWWRLEMSDWTGNGSSMSQQTGRPHRLSVLCPVSHMTRKCGFSLRLKKGGYTRSKRRFRSLENGPVSWIWKTLDPKLSGGQRQRVAIAWLLSMNHEWSF